MPLFQYKAIDPTGKFISGSLDAGNGNDLETRLEKMDLDLVTFKQKALGTDMFGRNKITRRDLINFSFYLEQLTRAGGPKPVRIEGKDTLSWVLMDYGGFVVHVFSDEAREYYDLERLWSDVPRLSEVA